MILFSKLVRVLFSQSVIMFYAVFLTKLPMSLRKHIDTYLGNRSEILSHEAVWFHLLIDQLYKMVFEATNNIYLYVLLPTREFRGHLINLLDLRLDFANCLKPMKVYKYGSFADRECLDASKFREFLNKHDWLFSRAVSRSVAAMNSLLQLRLQGMEPFLDDTEEYLEVYNIIRQLRMVNRRYVFGQLLTPDEVLD